MSIRTLTAALVISAIGISGVAYAGGTYVGGPKSSIPMTTATQSFEVKKPYAQYMPGTPVNTNRHIYRGGPQTGVPHGR
jgi:hypothetical protein